MSDEQQDDVLYVVKSRDGDWVRPDFGMTDDILCAGTWPEVEALRVAERRGRYTAMPVDDAWMHWYEHHGPEPIAGTVMQWLAGELNGGFYEALQAQLPSLPSPSEVQAALKRRASKMN
jgi:hypothetical protein